MTLAKCEMLTPLNSLLKRLLAPLRAVHANSPAMSGSKVTRFTRGRLLT